MASAAAAVDKGAAKESCESLWGVLWSELVAQGGETPEAWKGVEAPWVLSRTSSRSRLWSSSFCRQSCQFFIFSPYFFYGGGGGGG